MSENENRLSQQNPGDETETSANFAPSGGKPARTVVVSLLSAGVLIGVLSLGYIPRTLRAKEAVKATQQRMTAIPEVAAYVVAPGNANSPLILPGNIEPITEAVIYARIDGYVDQRLVDIGDRVRAGQLLAVISSPETDQELQAAKEALAQSKSDYTNYKAGTDEAKANLFIANVTNKRWQDLLVRNVVSQEEADQTQSTYMARQADLAASQAKQGAAQDAVRMNEAQVQRLRELVSYERVVAPFPGIITARNIDIGSLVSAGSSTNIPVLYKLGKVDRMRIFVDVPQADSGYIHLGQMCSIQIRELPNRVFTATVTRFADAIDVASRTMRTEVQIDNPKGELLPGMYAQVRFNLQRTYPPILIPANTVVPSLHGDQVVVVENGVAHFKTVDVAQDYGPEVEIGGGIVVGDSLVANVSDAIREGGKVQIVSHIQLPSQAPQHE